MYICQRTGKSVSPNTPRHTVVTERRQVVYQKPIFSKARPKDRSRKSLAKREIVDWEGVSGWEIVREIAVSPKVYERETGMSSMRVRKNQQQPRKLKNEQRQVESERAQQRRRLRKQKQDEKKTGW